MHNNLFDRVSEIVSTLVSEAGASTSCGRQTWKTLFDFNKTIGRAWFSSSPFPTFYSLSSLLPPLFFPFVFFSSFFSPSQPSPFVLRFLPLPLSYLLVLLLISSFPFLSLSLSLPLAFVLCLSSSPSSSSSLPSFLLPFSPLIHSPLLIIIHRKNGKVDRCR